MAAYDWSTVVRYFLFFVIKRFGRKEFTIEFILYDRLLSP